MKEIKFRAWDKTRNEYISAGRVLISIESGRNPVNNIYLDILQYPNEYKKRFILEQYTGLTDKNGKEIYEGDKVITEQLEYMDDCDTWHRSEFGNAYITMTPESGVVMKTMDNDIWDWGDNESITDLKFIEITGTIHDKEIEG